MKRLRFMMDLFGKITVGILFVTAIYIPVFYGWDNIIHVDILWQILATSAVCTLGSLLLPLEDEKEVPKVPMLIRTVLYYVYINLIVLGLGFLFGWFTFRNGAQVFGMELAIAAVFIVVYLVCAWSQYREAKRMNEKLRERERMESVKK